MTNQTIPDPPDLDTKLSIPYESIRYIPGYHETVVKDYARNYAMVCMAIAVQACEAIAEEHAKKWRATSKSSQHTEGKADGADECAQAVQALFASMVKP